VTASYRRGFSLPGSLPFWDAGGLSAPQGVATALVSSAQRFWSPVLRARMSKHSAETVQRLGGSGFLDFKLGFPPFAWWIYPDAVSGCEPGLGGLRTKALGRAMNAVSRFLACGIDSLSACPKDLNRGQSTRYLRDDVLRCTMPKKTLRQKSRGLLDSFQTSWEIRLIFQRLVEVRLLENGLSLMCGDGCGILSTPRRQHQAVVFAFIGPPRSCMQCQLNPRSTACFSIASIK